MARAFIGPGSSAMTVSAGSVVVTGALSHAFLVRWVSNTQPSPLFRGATSGNGDATYAEIRPAGNLRVRYLSTSAPTSTFTLTSGDWVLLTASKTAGSTAPTFGMYSYASDTWTRETLGSDFDTSAVATTFNLGSNTLYGQTFEGDIASIAMWNRALTTTEFDNLPYNLNSWVGSNPSALWVFDQQATTQAVRDWTGGGANQTSTSGTAVSTNSVPMLNYGHPVVLATRSAAPAVANLFTSQTPTGTDNSDGSPGITTATTVRFAQSGTVTGVRFYATTTVSGTYTGGLWQVTNNDDPGPGAGTLLASKVRGVAPTPGTWNSIAFDTPVAVTAGVLYRTGVHSSAGRYVNTAGFFTSDVINGDITADATGDDPGGLGTLRQGTFAINAAMVYPATSGSGASYFADVDFIPGATGTNPTATEATGAGTAYNAAVSTTASPTEASGAGTADNPAAAVAATTTEAVGAGAAYNPTVTAASNATATEATGTGVANTVAVSVGAQPGVAAGTGTADNPTASTVSTVNVNPTEATGTGVAFGPSPAVSASPTEAAGAGVAYFDVGSSISIDLIADNAVEATGAAYNPTVTTDVVVSVNAVEATGSGTALNPATAISAGASTATGAGTADNPTTATSSSVNVNATEAAATGAANSATAALDIPTGTAAGTGTAANPSVLTDTSTTVNPTEAVGAGTADTAAISLTAAADTAGATGSAYGATVTTVAAVDANALTAQATAQAFNALVAIGVTANPAEGSGDAYGPPKQRTPGVFVAGTRRSRLTAGTLRGPSYASGGSG